MSKKWRFVIFVGIAVGAVAILLRFVLPRLDNFWENILANVAVSAFVFAVAVWLIEGPLLTREHRLHRVVALAARRVAQLNEEIAITLSREMGEYLAGRLDSNVDLYGDERVDWTAFKSLLRRIFQEAKQVPEKGLPKINISLSEEDYRGYVKAASSFIEGVRGALGSSWEVQAQLLEMVEHLNKLGTCIAEANSPSTIRDEIMRYKALGAIGDAIIDLIEACPKMEEC